MIDKWSILNAIGVFILLVIYFLQGKLNFKTENAHEKMFL